MQLRWVGGGYVVEGYCVMWVNILFVQVGKFSNAVDSLGSKTLASIARAGPDAKVSAKAFCLV